MKVYHVPSKPSCPVRIQMSDDGAVCAIQVRDEHGYAFYWLLISFDLASRLIVELEMKVAYTLPDTPDSQIAKEG